MAGAHRAIACRAATTALFVIVAVVLSLQLFSSASDGEHVVRRGDRPYGGHGAASRPDLQPPESVEARVQPVTAVGLRAGTAPRVDMKSFDVAVRAGEPAVPIGQFRTPDLVGRAKTARRKIENRRAAAASSFVAGSGKFQGPPPLIFNCTQPPEFPVKWDGTTSDGRQRGLALVPFYVPVLNSYEYVEDLFRAAVNTSTTAIENSTHVVNVRVTPILFDNTGCARAHRVRRPDDLHYQSHAEKNAGINCEAFLILATRLKADIGLEVLRPMVPLGFGPTRNAIQQDALEVRKVPRFINSHNDAGLRTTGNLEVLLAAAVVFRQPYYVMFTHYDIVALYDAWVLEQYVGDWDEHLWYYGDVDYFSRGRAAGLPSAEAGGDGVDHLGGGSVGMKRMSPKAKLNFEVQGKLLEDYYRSRKEVYALSSDPFPKGSFIVRLDWPSCDGVDIIKLTATVCEVFDRWMKPWSVDLHTVDVPASADSSLKRLRCTVGWTPVTELGIPDKVSDIAERLQTAVGAQSATVKPSS